MDAPVGAWVRVVRSPRRETRWAEAIRPRFRAPAPADALGARATSAHAGFARPVRTARAEGGAPEQGETGKTPTLLGAPPRPMNEQWWAATCLRSGKRHPTPVEGGRGASARSARRRAARVRLGDISGSMTRIRAPHH